MTRVEVVGAVAFALALVLTPILRGLASRFGFVDRPNERSSHAAVMPRAGGAAITLAVLGAVALQPQLWRGSAALVLAGSLALGAIGLADDRVGLSPAVRITAQLAVALFIVAAVGAPARLPFPPPFDPPLGSLGMPVAVLWVVAVVNFFNFLDGIDGLATLQAAITSLGLAFAAWAADVAVLAVAVAGAALGFLPYNWSRATIFLGDAGSYFLGTLLATLPLTAPAETRSSAMLLVALSLWFFLADASLTLVRRATRGRRIWEAHREHAYQRLATSLGHARVALLLCAGSALLTGIGVAVWRTGLTSAAWAALALALLMFAGEELLAQRMRAA